MISKATSLQVKSVQRETSDCVSVEFQVPESLKKDFTYAHGQYLTLSLGIGEDELRRSYSLCSAPHENQWKIAAKEVPDGKFSTFLNRQLKKGDEIMVYPPEGRFTVPLDPQNEKHYLLFASGSGITPVLSIIKSILYVEPKSHVSLLYGNQSSEQIIFLEELLALKNKYLQQLQIHFLLSREDMEEPLFCGRICKEKLEAFHSHLFDLDDIDEFMICGPEEMNLEIRESLLAKGIPTKRIHMELFGISVARHRTLMSGNPGQSHIKVTADGRSFEFELAYTGISLLDAALNYSKALPFACKGGVCCTCKAKLIKGEVEMEVNYGLEPDEIANGYILTCQSHPRTPQVIIDYDK